MTTLGTPREIADEDYSDGSLAVVWPETLIWHGGVLGIQHVVLDVRPVVRLSIFRWKKVEELLNSC